MMDALSFVRFSKLYEWDIKRTTGITSKFRYSECCFGKVLSKANVEWVEIFDMTSLSTLYPLQHD